jgi:lipoprotein-anchoring transpeptidase ErfK/SrfK
VVARHSVRPIQAPVPPAASSGWVDVHRDARIDHRLLAAATQSGGERELIVDIQDQRAYLIVNGGIAIDTAVSTARTGKYTPRGEFKITERVRTGKTSNLYGCELPFWMRLDESAIGLHVGDLPGYPASAGCVRLPHDVAPLIFNHTGSGTVVRVVDSWDPTQIQQRAAPIMLAQVDAESSNS